MPVLERPFRFPLSVLAVGIQGKRNETEESRPQPYPWRLRFRGFRELAGRSGPRGEAPRREPQADYLLLPQSLTHRPVPQETATIDWPTTPDPICLPQSIGPPPQTPETATIGCLPVNFREQNRASLNLRNYPTRRERTSHSFSISSKFVRTFAFALQKFARAVLTYLLQTLLHLRNFVSKESCSPLSSKFKRFSVFITLW